MVMDRVISGVRIGGVFGVEHLRSAKQDGITPGIVQHYGMVRQYSRRRHRMEWFDLIGLTEGHNIWTDEGLNRLLDVFFHATTQTSTWYCAIFENDFTMDGDENYDVPGYTESTSYDEETRPAYNEAASSSKSMTNSANKAVFTISATKTIYGASLVSVNTKGDHTGGGNNVLACGGKFATSRACVDNDVLNLTYTVTSADDGA